jgi:hypothetical protein
MKNPNLSGSRIDRKRESRRSAEWHRSHGMCRRNRSDAGRRDVGRGCARRDHAFTSRETTGARHRHRYRQEGPTFPG